MQIDINSKKGECLDDLLSKYSPKIERYRLMPDLSRDASSPVNYVYSKLINSNILKDSHELLPPEEVPVEWNFDCLGTPLEHPNRSTSETFYTSQQTVLRSQSSVVWPHCFHSEDGLSVLQKNSEISRYFGGKVYRNDAVAAGGCPVFHQFDYLKVFKKQNHPTAQVVLSDTMQGFYDIYFEGIQSLQNKRNYLFCSPGMEIVPQGLSIELEGIQGGVVREGLLADFGIDPKLYSGIAIGFGLDRIAMAIFNIPDARLLWTESWSKDWEELACTPFPQQPLEKNSYNKEEHDLSCVIPNDISADAFTGLIEKYTAGVSTMPEVDVEAYDEYRNTDKFGDEKYSLTCRLTFHFENRDVTFQEALSARNHVFNHLESVYGFQIRRPSV